MTGWRGVVGAAWLVGLFVLGLSDEGRGAYGRAPWLWGGVWAVSACVLALGFVPLSRAWGWLLSRSVRWWGAGVMALALSLTVAFALGPFAMTPRVQDEINYVMQGKLLASGALWIASHPLADFFHYRFFVNDGRFYSLFQPGWPAVLGLGHLLGAPWLMGPLAASAAAGLMLGVGRRLIGEAQGRVAALLLVLSAVFVVQGGSMMAHMLASALGLGALYSGLRFREGGASWWLTVAGACLGTMFTVRAATAVALALPMIAAGLWLIRRREVSARALLWFGAGLVPVGSLQLIHNALMTGDPLSFAQDHYFALTESRPRCHRLGIAPDIGCKREHGPDLGPAGHFTWAQAVAVTRLRLEHVRWDLFGVGVAIGGLVLPCLSARAWRVKLLLGALSLSLVGVYFFYYYHGQMYGARYYFEALPYVMLLLVMGVDEARRGALSLRGALARRVVLALVLASALVWPAYSVTRDMPEKWAYYDSGWGWLKQAYQALGAAKLERDAVVLAPNNSNDYWAGFSNNRARLDGPLIIARDRGPRMNAQLRAYYPERDFYRLVFGADAARLVPVTLPIREGEVFFEGEAKWPPPRRSGGYAMVQDMRPWPRARASQGAQLFFETAQVGAWFEVTQWVPEAGRYTLEASLGMGPDYGVVAIEVDGALVGPPFDGYAREVQMGRWRAEAPVMLTSGQHTIRVRVIDRAAASSGWVAGLDSVTLQRVNEASPARAEPR